MARILVVEENPTQAATLRALLKSLTHEAELAESVEAALGALAQAPADLVLTDLHLSGMSGLDLLARIRDQFPLVPTILMTDRGSEEVAAEALEQGAVSYIPKHRLARDLHRTLMGILGPGNSDQRNGRLLTCWTEASSHFELDNDPALIPHLVAYFRDVMTQMHLCDENTLSRIGIALTESLENALFHGNLELSSRLREGDGRAWSTTALERRQQSPYKDRHLHVTARISHDEGRFIIRDEGPGFDPASLPDPTVGNNLESVSGRGVFLMRTFMDEVSYNAAGNELTLVKRRIRASASLGNL